MRSLVQILQRIWWRRACFKSQLLIIIRYTQTVGSNFEKLQYNMSKEHSDQDTRLTPNKFSSSRKIHSVVAETQRALQHYIHFRKEELQSTRKHFLEKLYSKKIQQKALESEQEEILRKQSKEKKRKKKKKQIVKQKPVRQIERRSRLRRVDYRQSQESPQPRMFSNQRNHSKSPSLSSKSQSSSSQKAPSFKGNCQDDDLKAVGTYQIRPVHDCILELQKTIDSFIDYQFVHRRRYSVSHQDLFQFLKTTKYGLKCRKYLDYLQQYNSLLYQYKNDRIICKQLSSQKIDERIIQTRTKMTQKEIIELLI